MARRGCRTRSTAFVTDLQPLGNLLIVPPRTFRATVRLQENPGVDQPVS